MDESVYVPVLRLKQGEYLALTEVAKDVVPRLRPHFVIPPVGERDPEKGRSLEIGELVPDSGYRVGRYWPLRPCFLDPRFLFTALGESESAKWLPKLFETAAYHGARATPVASLSDLNGPRLHGFQAVSRTEFGLAIRLTFDELGTPELHSRLLTSIEELAISPLKVSVILDFSEAALEDVDAVSELIVASYHEVIEIAQWPQIIFEATSFPEVNPVRGTPTATIPRNDWKAWVRAGEKEKAIRTSLTFGDFAADSAKFAFGSGAIKPIPHHRYSTSESWFAAGGSQTLPTLDAMRWVSKQIAESAHFAGPSFSTADATILERARGLIGPGSAPIWRKLNTVHHLTRVVTDLGPLFGYSLSPSAVPASVSQPSLF